MSIALMTLAWRSGAPSGQKLVLLALCDNANDDGECRPSVAYLARKTSLGESTVRNHIAMMEEAGILRRHYRTGRSSYYFLDSSKFVPPADETSPENQHPPESGAPQNLAPAPAESGGAPPQILAPTPAESGPRTVSKPSKETSGKQNKSGEVAAPDFSPHVYLSAHGVQEQTERDWLAHRKAKKAPVTETVLDGFVREAASAGVTLEFALRYSIEANWIFFRADWYGKNHGTRDTLGATGQQQGRFSPTAYVNQGRKGGAQ